MKRTSHLKKEIRRTVSPNQREPLRSEQVKNSAGGYVFAVDNWTQLRRFLILGTAGGTFYVSERDLTKEGLSVIKACLAEDGSRTVAEIVSVSREGRAAKNDYAIFALACVVALGNDNAKRAALDKLDAVCRIGTHLYQFVDFLNDFGCLTGRAKRRALARWYTTKNVDKLAYDVIKYRQRDGWSHRDILRLAHPGSLEPVGSEHAQIFDWVTKGYKLDSFVMKNGEFVDSPLFSENLGYIEGFERAQRADSVEETAFLVDKYGLPREALKTEHLKSPVVWEALLANGMPLTAMIRNLGNMTRIGVLTAGSDGTRAVVNALSNEDAIRRARIHPFNVLVALKTYQSGQGFRGTNSWSPVGKIVDALDGAFYKSFGNVESTGKRICIAIDISGSMAWYPIANTNLYPRDAAAAMSLVTAATEPDHEIVVFSAGGSYGRRGSYGYNTGIKSVDVSPRQRLDDVVRRINGMSAGGTDCALPMIWAAEQGRNFDAFIVYTDNETWAGNVHPAKALVDYRKKFVSDAKLIVVGMTATNFSIADPKDRGMLDVVGFDSAAPTIMSEFISGRI